MATFAQDKEAITRWALGLLATANISAILWIGNVAIELQSKLAVKEAVDNARIEGLTKEIVRLYIYVDAFKQDQKNRDDEQDKFREAVIARDDKYWEQKKRGEKLPY